MNILVILCDQLRYDFLSMYGCSAIPTPHLDALCKDGVVFDNAITQSTVCAPARATMMTGRYVSDHGVWTNDVPFRDGLDYLPKMMNDIGYETACFGKLHHFPADDAKGFQHVCSMEENRLGEKDDYFKYLKSKHPEVTKIFNHNNFTFDFPEEDYYDCFIADNAIDFIKNHTTTQPSKPFLSWVSFQGPHGPYDPPEEVKGSVDVAKIPKPLKRLENNIPSTVLYRQILSNCPETEEKIMDIRTAYSEMIVEIDKQIGKIINTLKKLSIYKDTAIIFSADHGDLLYDFGIGAKGPFPYRGQLNIPLVIANHPDVPKNTRCESLVGNIDIPGTVLDIAESNRHIGYSRSLLDLFRTKSKCEREVNFSQFCDSIKTVEDKQYKYSYYPFENTAELYDKINDPNEQHNLSGKKEYIALEAKYLKHIIDFECISKGVEVEAHDLVPEKQEGLKAKYPNYQDDIKLAYPLMTKSQLEWLEKAQLSSTYNEFCKDKDILSDYGLYWKDAN